MTDDTPHIYISALPFERKDSLISKTFMPLFPNTLSVDYLGSDVEDGGDIKRVSFSSDGRRILCSLYTGELVLYETATGNIITTRTRDKQDNQQGRLFVIACSHDGLRISAGYENGAIKVWESAHPDDAPMLLKHTSGITCLTFSPDSRYIASGSKDLSVCLWDPGNSPSPKKMHGPRSHTLGSHVLPRWHAHHIWIMSRDCHMGFCH